MSENHHFFFASFTLAVFMLSAGCSSSGSSADPENSAPGSSSSGTAVSGKADAWRDTCAAVINAYRATESAAALSRNTSEESCVDMQAAADLASNSAHGHFGNCDEYAQNTAPNVVVAYYGDPADMARQYLKMMWEDEKVRAEAGDTVYSDIGHYVNMRNKNYTSVACGIAYSADSSKAWINIDFYY